MNLPDIVDIIDLKMVPYVSIDIIVAKVVLKLSNTILVRETPSRMLTGHSRASMVPMNALWMFLTCAPSTS